MTTNILEQLLQFMRGPIWDGNLISKSNRDHLYKYKYIQRSSGYQFLTPKGVDTLVELGFLRRYEF